MRSLGPGRGWLSTDDKDGNCVYYRRMEWDNQAANGRLAGHTNKKLFIQAVSIPRKGCHGRIRYDVCAPSQQFGRPTLATHNATPVGLSSPRPEWWTNHTAGWAFPALRSLLYMSVCMYNTGRIRYSPWLDICSISSSRICQPPWLFLLGPLLMEGFLADPASWVFAWPRNSGPEKVGGSEGATFLGRVGAGPLYKGSDV